MKNISFVRMLISFAIAAVLLSHISLADGNRGRGRAALKAQLTQFDGGCPPNPLEVIGGCIDVQFSVHRAPSCTNGPNANINGYSISMIRDNADAALEGGSSTLVRASDGLAFNLISNGLARNAPYTVWWVGFNPDNTCITDDPAVCTCGPDRLRAGQDSIFYATGAMSDKLETATFAGEIIYGEVPDGFDQVPFGGAFGVGIQEGAEIHFVVRAHGRALKGNRGRGSDSDSDSDSD